MTSELWREVEAIFAGALDLPESERRAWIEERTASHPGLREELVSLLRAHEKASQFLETSAPAGSSAWIGRRLGPYRILEEIGRGGMGAVFRAEREDQFQKEVAIKIIGPGVVPAAMLRRFLDERQILARLEHPHIARLLDGGATPDGVPFMVMEYIHGTPITQYCVDQHLAISARLELFQTVCSAAHYAHQHLVVHRDIKPGNILVTRDGVPVLLDFGIARMLDPVTSAAAETLAASQPLTPEYASPEQLRGEPATTAGDVYSLGLLLQELLTGRRPYSLANVSRAEAIRIVSAKDQAKPGTGEEDLDQIVMKAVRREPEERYASARELAEDVTRYLQGLPVLARRASLGYITHKTVSRHKVAFGGAAAALLVAVAGVAAVGWEGHVAREERARAQKRFNEVRGLAHAVIFDLHDAIARLPGSTEARRTLATRALAYLDSLARDSAGDTNLQMELAEAYRRVGDVQGKWNAPNLGDPKGALASYGKGLAVVQRALLTATDRNLVAQAAKLTLSIGEIHIGLLDGPQAHRFVGKGLELMRGSPHDRSEMAGALLDMFLATRLTDFSGAGTYLEQAAQAYQDALADEPNNHGRQRNAALAERYLASYGNADAALPHLKRALALDERCAEADPMDPGTRLNVSFDLLEIGHALMNAYQFKSALEYYRRALALREVLAGADPKDALAQTRFGFARLAVGRALFATGATAAAVASARASLAIFTDTMAANPADKNSLHWVVENNVLIGDGDARLGRMNQACAAYQHGLQAYQAVGAARTPNTFLTKLKARIDVGLLRCGGAQQAP